MTINEALCLVKVVRERLGELRSLRAQVATKDTYYGDGNKIVEPMYDVKIIDRKIVYLENFLFQTDSKIKTSNAITQIDMNVDVETLLAPLE